MSRKPSAHVQEGRARFAQAAPDATLFESAEAQAARDALHHRLEFFPTPPWAVRALMAQLPHITGYPGHILEPACGRGHIMTPLRQLGFDVWGGDVHDHIGDGRVTLGDFTDAACVAAWARRAEDSSNGCQAVITNPPFRHAEAFARNGLMVSDNVFLLCRLSFLCSAARYDLHATHLQAVYPFAERVPMVLGRYDPKAATATEYAWFHFRREPSCDWPAPLLIHIPPGSREKHQKPEDVRI